VQLGVHSAAHCPDNVLHACPSLQSPQLPPQPSGPQLRPLHEGVHATHCPALQVAEIAQLPQLPPQPLSPQVRPAQFGVQLVQSGSALHETSGQIPSEALSQAQPSPETPTTQFMPGGQEPETARPFWHSTAFGPPKQTPVPSLSVPQLHQGKCAPEESANSAQLPPTEVQSTTRL
jgi:hypothetical protein